MALEPSSSLARLAHERPEVLPVAGVAGGCAASGPAVRKLDSFTLNELFELREQVLRQRDWR